MGKIHYFLESAHLRKENGCISPCHQLEQNASAVMLKMSCLRLTTCGLIVFSAFFLKIFF